MIKIKIHINVIAQSLSCSRQTVWYWKNQDLRCRFDIPRNYLSKITIDAEASILFFRGLGYGAAKIQQRLFCVPELELKRMEISIQGLIVSRQTINKILKKHKLNGYSKKNKKAWKFFRAKYTNELWQLDLKPQDLYLRNPSTSVRGQTNQILMVLKTSRILTIEFLSAFKNAIYSVLDDPEHAPEFIPRVLDKI